MFLQFEAQNVPIFFLTAIYSFMVENRLQRPSGVFVCPVFNFSSRTCAHARHVILMVYLMCDAHFAIFFLFTLILLFFLFFNLFLNFHFSLKLFLICFYFSGNLSLTVLIKCVLFISSRNSFSSNISPKGYKNVDDTLILTRTVRNSYRIINFNFLLGSRWFNIYNL